MWSFIRDFITDPQATPDDVNLLLLGERGVGKSTLINSISNYFHYTTFAKAQKEKIELLIPMCLNLAEKSKVFGKPDDNEVPEPGQSVTQNVKVYQFPIKLYRKTINLKLIDAPGVGDPRGIEQDNINLDNVLAYLGTLKELHGICFVFKSNQTRFTQFAEYCLKQILTRLDKSASQNIIFITTHSKIAGYTTGKTKSHCLEPLVKSIRSKPPHVSIPLSDKNIFAVDNEAFKALLESQGGIYYDQLAMRDFQQSWIKSTNEIQRLLKYIIGNSKNPALKPHDVENTVNINEARFLIKQLTTPIAEVSELMQDIIILLDIHQKRLKQEDEILDQLKDQLYISYVDFEVKKLDQPVTVCTEPTCTEIVKVNNVTLRLYKQQCHKPCYMKGVPKEMVGDPQLEDCAVMVQGNCMYCQCSWKKHLHIYEETQKVVIKKEDENVKNTLKSKEDARLHIEKTVNNVNQRKRELEAEGEIISETIAKFAYFLQEHALIPFNDLHSAYIKQRIRELKTPFIDPMGMPSYCGLPRKAQDMHGIVSETHLGKFTVQQVITKLESMLKDDAQLQKTLQENPRGLQTASSDLTFEGIKNSFTELYNLKHMGKKIQELIKKSSNSRRKEHRENFNCLVSQEIDLNKNIAEEQYENREYSESYYDVSGMQQGRNKSSENEYGPEATGDHDHKEHQSVSRNPKKRPTEKMSKSSKPHHGSYNAILTDDDSDSAKPVSTKDEGRRGDGKEHHSTSRNPISRTQDDQQKLTPPAADMQKELASISDNVNNQENLMQNGSETMKKQQENVKQFMEKIGLLLESNKMENIDTLKKQLKSFLSDSEDDRNEHHQTEHSEHNESETISKDVESAIQKESPENELDYKVTYTYRTNNSEDDKSSKPRTEDARPEYPSPERTYNDPREPRHSGARYHHEEDKRLAEASGRRNHRSNFFPRSTSPGRYHPTTERKSHRRDHRTHYSPRRYRRRSESYNSSDRDFNRSSHRHATRYTDESESYDSDDNPSRNRTKFKSYKAYDSSDDRHKKSRHVKNKSSRRRRSSEEDIDTKREKKSHRRHHKGKRSSRRHHSSSESYDSDDDESRRSFSSGSASSARSFDSRSSVKRSKDKTGRSRDSEQHRSTRTEKKSRQEVKESSRRHGHRSRSDISDSDDRDSRKWSQRSGNKHSRRKDKSDCDSGGHTIGNGLKKSKNQRQSNKKHDSVGDRPVKSSKSAHSVPKDKKKTGDSNDTRPAKSSKSGNTKDEMSATLGKSDLVDPHSSQSSAREPNSNKRESEKQPNKNKENCDSLDKQSVKSSNKDTVQVSKPKNKIRSKSE
ncbi:hypothetical protein Zmor_015086 [Zophobas morio]|uniref:DUF8206 domain-containing protein n=1 Tax=Zophobas morio TaxID=2755281 RepID=A0AA38ILS9_9CUCU|nr:hypothetical protein Zmor_015086 [Zophobas morio]